MKTTRQAAYEYCAQHGRSERLAACRACGETTKHPRYLASEPGPLCSICYRFATYQGNDDD
jgi:formylmethanofuran dehydrogenase subunit E